MLDATGQQVFDVVDKLPETCLVLFSSEADNRVGVATSRLTPKKLRESLLLVVGFLDKKIEEEETEHV